MNGPPSGLMPDPRRPFDPAEDRGSGVALPLGPPQSPGSRPVRRTDAAFPVLVWKNGLLSTGRVVLRMSLPMRGPVHIGHSDPFGAPPLVRRGGFRMTPNAMDLINDEAREYVITTGGHRRECSTDQQRDGLRPRTYTDCASWRCRQRGPTVSFIG